MTEYRRAYVPGAAWFFTVNLAERKGNRLLVKRIETLREAFEYVRSRHAFRINAVVVLPDHFIALGSCRRAIPSSRLAGGGSKGVSPVPSRKASGSRKACPEVSKGRAKRGERGLWQRRFWEHLIRDQNDFNRHADYIHWNPVKHGWVRRVTDWPHSSFHAYLRAGVYTKGWGGDRVADIDRSGE